VQGIQKIRKLGYPVLLFMWKC